MKNIGVFVGSIRKASFSSAIAHSVLDMEPERLHMELVGLGGLAMFNQDFDDEGVPPAEWSSFRETVRKLDGFMFITPEYNRSVPPVLKNAIDIASRPSGQNLWAGKPGGIISVSPGSIGGFGANHHLRQILSSLDVYAMNQPEVYLGRVADVLDESGVLINSGTRSFLQAYITAFADWVNVFRK